MRSSSELIATILALVQLYALAHTVFYCMGRTTYLTFLLIHTNSALRLFELPAKLVAISDGGGLHPAK
jgi:hypothetical protein